MALKEVITKDVLLLLTINSIIGTGIFFLPSVSAGVAGPASLLSWIAVSIIAILISFYFGEMVSMFPKSGGVYEYVKSTFGDFPGFIVGWTSWIVANITIAMLIIGGLEYLSSMFLLTLTQKIIIALLFVLMMNIINYRGIELSVKVLLLFSIVTIAILWLMITWGSFRFDPSNLTPFFILPVTGLATAMFFALETFFGWETTTFLTEETKDAKKNVPRALVLGTVIVSILAILVVLVSLGVSPWYSFAFSNVNTYEEYVSFSERGLLLPREAPLSYLALLITSPKVVSLLRIFIFLNILGAAAAWIISTPRLVFAISRDKLLPENLSKIHSKYGTPYNAIILQTFLTSLIILSGSYMHLLKILLPLAVFVYSAVLLSLSFLYFKNKSLDSEFKSPLPRVLPLVIIVIMFWLIWKNTPQNIIITSLAFVAVGIPLYLTAIMGYNKKIIWSFHELLAPVIFLFNYYSTSQETLDEVVKYMSSQRKVVDFGCGVGIVTTALAKSMIGSKIYGLDFSPTELMIANQVKQKKNLHNLEYYKVDISDIDKNKDLKNELKTIDGAVSIAFLGYLDNPRNFLIELSKRMEPKSKVYFIEYKYPSQVWNKPWVDRDDLIKEYFGVAGFKVEVKRERFLFWEYVKMYGTKIERVKPKKPKKHK